jgi:PAS domain S-box-containing protein
VGDEERFVEHLVTELAAALGAAVTMVSVFADDARTRLRTLAVYLDGQPAPNFEYEVAGSPCERVVGQDYRYVRAGVLAQLDPHDAFAAAGLDAFAAFPLTDSAGTPLGVLAALDRQPIARGDAEHAETMLKVVAGRLVAELERRAATEALRQSEASYRTIFDSAELAIYVHDWDSGLLTDANPRACADHRMSREELLRADPHLLTGRTAPYDFEHALAKLLRAKEGALAPFEWRLEHPWGEVRWYEITLKPAQIDRRRCILAYGRDVTERKLAEAQLRQSEEQYRAIFNASEDAMVLWDDQFRRVDVNSAHERLYGFKREEVIGHGYERLPYAPEYAQPRLDLVRRALAGDSCKAELHALRKDGSYVLTEVHAIPFNHRGAPHVLAIARDITERKRAEAELRAREEQYRAIFDGSADAMLLWSAELTVLDVNEVYLRWTGFTREEVLQGLHVRLLDPEDVRQRVALVRRALEGKEGLMESVVRARDGSQFDIELRYVPVRYGGVAMALAIGRDLRPRRAAEAERLQLEAQLRQAQKMEAIGQLTGGIAHDFNNILTSVLGYVVLAQGRAESHADARLVRQLDQAKLATERARDLVAQMLAFARRKPAARRALRPLPLVHQAIDMLRPTLPSSVVLELEHDAGELPPIEADAVQLEQVIMNLVINARDAMEGSGRVGLALRRGTGGWRCQSCGETVPPGRWVELTVADTGSGIGPETMARMFDPFFSTKAAGRGSGMGLAMVHGIVHEHGGHIGVKTALGQGTTFRVLLPAVAAPAVAPGGAAPAPSAAGPALRGHVLVVEDDTLVGNFLVELLGEWGLEVTLMRDPRQALAWLKDATHAADLLLTDLTMPQLTGVQLAREATALRPGLPVLLVSGDLGGTDAQQLARAGVRHTLAKPLAPAVLRERLQELLGA